MSALEENDEGADHGTGMECRLRLWELTEGKSHLQEAKRLLDFAVAHSPEEYRASMIENAPLHRVITQAWEERGDSGAS